MIARHRPLPKRRGRLALAIGALSAIAFAASALPADAGFPGKPGRIAFTQDDVGGVEPHGIATANPDGSDERLVGPTCQEGEPAPCPDNAAWSRHGERIAFDVGGAIGTMSADGSDVKTFTVPGVTDLTRPSWAPSDSLLVFDGVDQQGTRNLYVARDDGTDVRKLTFVGGSQPAWSLDDRVAFVRRGNINVIEAGGGKVRRVTGKGGAQPNWSPFASKIAFVRAGNVYRVGRDGPGLRKLTGKGGFEPAWSPEGQHVLFHRIDSAQNRRIYSVNLNAADLRLLTGGVEGRRRSVHSVDQQPLP